MSDSKRNTKKGSGGEGGSNGGNEPPIKEKSLEKDLIRAEETERKIVEEDAERIKHRTEAKRKIKGKSQSIEM